MAAGRGLHRHGHVHGLARLERERSDLAQLGVDGLLQLGVVLLHLVGETDAVDRQGALVGHAVGDLHVLAGVDQGVLVAAVDELLHLKQRRIRARGGGHRRARHVAARQGRLRDGHRRHRRGRAGRARDRGARTGGFRNRGLRHLGASLVDVLALRRGDLDADVLEGARREVERLGLLGQLRVDLVLQLLVILADLVRERDVGQFHVAGVADAVPDLHLLARSDGGVLAAVDALFNVQAAQLNRRADNVVARAVGVAVHVDHVDQAGIRTRVRALGGALADSLRQVVRRSLSQRAGDGDVEVLVLARLQRGGVGDLVAAVFDLHSLVVDDYLVDREAGAAQRHVPDGGVLAVDQAGVADADDVLVGVFVAALVVAGQRDVARTSAKLLDGKLRPLRRRRSRRLRDRRRRSGCRGGRRRLCGVRRHVRGLLGGDHGGGQRARHRRRGVGGTRDGGDLCLGGGHRRGRRDGLVDVVALRCVDSNLDDLLLARLQGEAAALSLERAVERIGERLLVALVQAGDVIDDVDAAERDGTGVSHRVAHAHLAVRVHNRRVVLGVRGVPLVVLQAEDVLEDFQLEGVGAGVVGRGGRLRDHALRDRGLRNRGARVRRARNRGGRHRHRRHHRTCHVDVTALRCLDRDLHVVGAAGRNVERLDLVQLRLDLVGQVRLGCLGALSDLVSDGDALGLDVAVVEHAVGDHHVLAGLDNVAVVDVVDVLLDRQVRRIRSGVVRRGGHGDHRRRHRGARHRGVRVRRARNRGARDSHRRNDRLCDVHVTASRRRHRNAHLAHLTRLQRERRLLLQRGVDVALQRLGHLLVGGLGDLVVEADAVDTHGARVGHAVEDLHVLARRNLRALVVAVDELLDLQLRRVRVRGGGDRGRRDRTTRHGGARDGRRRDGRARNGGLRNRGLRVGGARDSHRRDGGLRDGGLRTGRARHGGLRHLGAHLVGVLALVRGDRERDVLDFARREVEGLDLGDRGVDLLLEVRVVFLDLVRQRDAGQRDVARVADAVPDLHLIARGDRCVLAAVDALLNVQAAQLNRLANNGVVAAVRVAVHVDHVDQAIARTRVVRGDGVALADGCRQGVRGLICDGAVDHDLEILVLTDGELSLVADEVAAGIRLDLSAVDGDGVDVETNAAHRHVPHLRVLTSDGAGVAHTDGVLGGVLVLAGCFVAVQLDAGLVA